jgi:hypothetical protein
MIRTDDRRIAATIASGSQRAGLNRSLFHAAMSKGEFRPPQSVHVAFIDNARLFLRVTRIKP